MKKIITAILIIAGANVFADSNPAPPVYCDCVGIGIQEKSNPQVPTSTTTMDQKFKKVNGASLDEKILFEMRLLWLYMNGIRVF